MHPGRFNRLTFTAKLPAMSTIRFELRYDKVDQDGKAPIRVIYQIKGQRKTLQTQNRCYPHNWSVAEQKAIYLDKNAIRRLGNDSKNVPYLMQSEVNEINRSIQNLRDSINDQETLNKIGKKVYTPISIMNGIKERMQPESMRHEPGVNVVDFIDRFVREQTELKSGTLKEYKALANHLKDYEKSKSTKFTFEGDASILTYFSDFLTKSKNVNNITNAKLIATFKAVLRHAKQPPYKIKSNPDYFDLKLKIKRNDNELEVIALTQEELDAVLELDLRQNRALDEARDIFCFSCATALRYQDLRRLDWDHIQEGMILIPMSNKNSTRVEVAVNPISAAILQKYSGMSKPLPVPPGKQNIISSQKLGKHIKEIGKLAGIDSKIRMVRPYGNEQRELGIFPKYQLLSIHTGRRTFITISLNSGMPIHDVMTFSTHKKYEVLKRYTFVTTERRKAVMKAFWGDKSKNKLKAV